MTPERALSVRQPWAWLIVNGYKDVENRKRRLYFTGRLYIHASEGMTRREYEVCRGLASRMDWKHDPKPLFRFGVAVHFPNFEDLERGGIVGAADMTGCVDASPSPWFFGPHGYTLANAEPLPFRQCKGALGLFTPEDPR